ncbi:hypothetical protein D3C73_818160 [compost metagenome]
MRQHHAILEKGAPGHGVAGVDVFSHGMLHETGGCYERDLAAAHIGFIDQTADTTEMVGMGVRDHYRHDRALAEFFIDEIQRSLGGFLRHQGVEHNPARIALDECDIGQVEPTHLVNLFRNDLIQTEGHVEYRLALQGRIDTVVVLAPEQEVIAAHVPGDISGFGHDLVVGRCRDEAFPGFFKITFVRERKGLAYSILRFDRVGRRRFTLAVEVRILCRCRFRICVVCHGSKEQRADAAPKGDCQCQMKGLVVHGGSCARGP